MKSAIQDVSQALATLGKGSPWSPDTKVSDDFLQPLFIKFYRMLGLPNLMNKSDYHVLAAHVPRDEIDPEVSQVLDLICQAAAQARPA